MVEPIRDLATSRFSLSGLRVLITGAAGGIGSATARACGAMGASLILVDRLPVDTLAKELRDEGMTTLVHVCDVSARIEVEALCSQLGLVDVAILNAGVNLSGDWQDPAWDENFDRVMSVNVMGVLNFARALQPGMTARGSGRFVILGSVAGFTGGGSFKDTPPDYVIAKGGIHAFVRWLARKAGPNVQVNGIAPGTIDTGINVAELFHPPSNQIMPRLGVPWEIAWPIAFLSSPAASFMTGAILDVNGGNFLR